MKHVIYIDVLFILNLFINYILLILGAKLMHTQEKRWRMLLGAVLGAVYGVLVFFTPNLSFLTTSLMKFIVSLIIIAIAYRMRSVRVFLKGVACFYCATFAFTGILIAIWFAAKPQGLMINNGAVYFDISSVTLIISAIVSYVGITLCTHFMRRMAPQNCNYEVEIFKNGQSVTGRGLMDTGNGLSDGFTDTPVVVASYDFIQKLLPEQARPYFKNPTTLAGDTQLADCHLRLIPSKSVAGTRLLAAFQPDHMKIKQGKKQQEITRVLIAVTEEAIKNGEYQILLHTSLWNQ